MFSLKRRWQFFTPPGIQCRCMVAPFQNTPRFLASTSTLRRREMRAYIIHIYCFAISAPYIYDRGPAKIFRQPTSRARVLSKRATNNSLLWGCIQYICVFTFLLLGANQRQPCEIYTPQSSPSVMSRERGNVLHSSLREIYRALLCVLGGLEIQ